MDKVKYAEIRGGFLDLCGIMVTLNTERLEPGSFKYVLQQFQGDNMDKWVIKNVDKETRQKIKGCARTNGLTIADYLRTMVGMDIVNLGEQWTIHNVDSRVVALLVKNAKNRKVTLAEYLKVLAVEDKAESKAVHDLQKFNRILSDYA